jgi:hypothetical protein
MSQTLQRPGQLSAALACGRTASLPTAVDAWAYRERSKWGLTQRLYEYPAMMVPPMLGELLEWARASNGSRSVLDPFAGSGSVLSQAMLAGMNVRLQDLNPLAVLITKAKAGPFHIGYLADAAQRVVRGQQRADEGHNDPYLRKWYSSAATSMLRGLQLAIRDEPEAWARRFLWTALAETARRTSNSKPTTYKLHCLRTANSKQGDVGGVFRRVVERNIEEQARFADALGERALLSHGEYLGIVEVAHHDSRIPSPGTFDLILTSPPYGDGHTTIPYGQASYLPLRWIDLDDIAPNLGRFLHTTHEIDSQSLGGRRSRGDLLELSKEVRAASPVLDRTIRSLLAMPRDRPGRVIAFARDLEAAFRAWGPATHSRSLAAVVLGPRVVGGVEVALPAIARDILLSHGWTYLGQIDRPIPSKRMPGRNARTRTIREESVLLMSR